MMIRYSEMELYRELLCTVKLNDIEDDHLKGCDTGWFILPVLCFTLSTVWSIFHRRYKTFRKFDLLLSSGVWLSLYWHICIVSWRQTL